MLVKKYITKTTLLIFLLLIIIGSITACQNFRVRYDFSGYHDCSPVGIWTDLTITDTTREDKVIKVRLRRGSGTCLDDMPIVIVSHGGSYDDGVNFNGDSNRVWGEKLARAGYVVVHVSHTRPSNIAAQRLCSKFGLVHGVGTDLCGTIPISNRFLRMANFERPADVLAVLKHIEDTNSPLRRELDASSLNIDFERIAIFGWSAGTQAVLTLAGAKRKLERNSTIYEMMLDPDLQATASTNLYGKGLLPLHVNPDAFVALSPQGVGFNGYYCENNSTDRDSLQCPSDDNSFAHLDVPLFVSTGSLAHWHGSHNAIDPINRRHVWDFLNPPTNQADKYLLFIGNNGSNNAQGAVHGLFNLKPAITANMQEPAAAIEGATIAFLDAHLKGLAVRRGAANFLSDLQAIRNKAADHPNDNSATETDPRMITSFSRR